MTSFADLAPHSAAVHCIVRMSSHGHAAWKLLCVVVQVHAEEFTPQTMQTASARGESRLVKGVTHMHG